MLLISKLAPPTLGAGIEDDGALYEEDGTSTVGTLGRTYSFGADDSMTGAGWKVELNAGCCWIMLFGIGGLDIVGLC